MPSRSEYADIAVRLTRDLFAEHDVRLERLPQKLQELVAAAFIRGVRYQVNAEISEMRALRDN